MADRLTQLQDTINQVMQSLFDVCVHIHMHTHIVSISTLIFSASRTLLQ